MNSGLFKLGAFTTCLVLGESAVGNNYGSSGGLVSGSSDHPAPVKVAASLWGEHTMIPNLERRTESIRRTAATELQRRIAEQNAKAFFKQLTPTKKAELRKEKIKAVLIRTARSPQTSPKAQDVRMLYLLEGEALVDGYAYEFPTPLQAGTIARAQGLEPEYVGL